MTTGINGMVCKDAVGEVYLRAQDVIDALNHEFERFERLIAAAKRDDLNDLGRLQLASLVGASAALQQMAQQVDLVCIEMATEAAEIVDREEHGG